MQPECEAPSCSRESGHEGPHGHEIQSGIILAPWSDMERKRLDQQDDPPIPCNSCGNPLILHETRTRAHCSSPTCEQHISISEQRISQTVMAKLYPSKMTDPAMLREFADHQVSEWEFMNTLRVRFGLLSDDEFQERRARTAQAREDFIAKEVIPLEATSLGSKRWWQFWSRP